MSAQIIHFDQMDVTVEQHHRNEWTAHATENYDYDSPMGYGSTMMEAIVDLREKLSCDDTLVHLLST
jgi:hypothetical protein